MGKVQKEWARKARIELMMILGGYCVCGADDNLEFDCIIPQGDTHHKYDTSHRMSFYRRQHFQFKNLQILCAKCHNKKTHYEQLLLEKLNDDDPF